MSVDRIKENKRACVREEELTSDLTNETKNKRGDRRSNELDNKKMNE